MAETLNFQFDVPVNYKNIKITKEIKGEITTSFPAFTDANLPTCIYHFFHTKYNDITDRHLIELKNFGVSHIQLNPVHQGFLFNTPENHNWWQSYQITGFKLDTGYGNMHDLSMLITRARTHGLEIIVDVVFNHLRGLFNSNDKEALSAWAEIMKISKYNYIDLVRHIEYSGTEKQKDLVIRQAQSLILEFLGESEWKDEYYFVLSSPNECDYNKTEYADDWPCWFGSIEGVKGTLPNLNLANELVDKKIMKAIEVLARLGISGMRFDAAKLMGYNNVRRYINHFNSISSALYPHLRRYSYSEVILSHDQYMFYPSEIPVTNYSFLETLKSIFHVGSDYRSLQFIHHNRSNSVIFSGTHDTLPTIENDGNPSLPYYRVEHDDSILMSCFILQHIYNVPMIFKTYIDDERIRKAMDFRHHLKMLNVRIEKSYVDNFVLRSFKYDKYDRHIGTFYINFSGQTQTVDGFDIAARNVHSVKHIVSDKYYIEFSQ